MKTKKKEKKEKKRTFFQQFRDSILILLNIIIGFLLLVSAKLSAISPNDFIFSSYPNYLLLILAILNLLFFFHWLFRRKFWLLLSLVFFVVTFSNLQTWFPITLSPKGQPMGKEIKVLTYNTMQFSGYSPHTDQHANPIIKYIQNCDADIVCLQEAGYKQSSEFLTKKTILKELKAYPYQVSVKVNEEDANSTNVWIFSKYPIDHSEQIPYQSTTNGSLFCDITIGDTKIRVINSHLESNKLTSKDKALYQEIINQPDKEKITEVAQKLGQKLTPAAVSRAKQAEKVASYIQQSPYPVIACGDFNDIPNSYTYRTLKKGMKDAWVENRTGLGITFHEKFYLFRIDFILHSPELISYGTQVDKNNSSDHYPLWTYFQLP